MSVHRRVKRRIGGGRGRALFPALFTAALCVLFARPMTAAPDPSTSLEYQLKAAFLYKFTKFVEWPPEDFIGSAPNIVVGVLGSGPMEDALQAIQGKEVLGRTVTIRHVEDLEGTADCHVLFIDHSEEPRLEEILHKVASLNILTVSEMDHFAERGGMINFIIKNNKVSFEVNPEAATEANLRISSKLLRLATIVEETK